MNCVGDKIMLEWFGKHKKTLIFLSAFLLIVIPIGIGLVYDFCFTERIPAGDLLAYYGSVLSFIGTVLLGLLALYQNDAIQNKIDENEKLRNMPRFYLQCSGINSSKDTAFCKLTNISENIATNVDFVIYSVMDSETSSFMKSFKYIKPMGEETIDVKFDGKLTEPNATIKGVMNYRDEKGEMYTVPIKGTLVDNVGGIIFSIK